MTDRNPGEIVEELGLVGLRGVRRIERLFSLETVL